jgi:predicted nucleic acid-binding protein
MKTVFFDVNIILDIIFLRLEHNNQSAVAVAAAARNGMKIMISAASYNVISYISCKKIGKINTLKAMEKIRMMFEIAGLDAAVIDKALASDFDDFEDALQYYSAIDAGADCVVTRDKKGFKSAVVIPAFSPEEFIMRIKNS